MFLSFDLNSLIRTMQVVVLTNESLKKELMSNVTDLAGDIIWIENLSQFGNYKNSDAFIDLLFEEQHVSALQSLLPKLIIINSVEATLTETDPAFVRINGWPTFLKSPILEASSKHANTQEVEKVFSFFNKKLEWVPDDVGFVTPRVVSTIINEAFIALKEGVSTKQEIDIAMKLGTNYPYGPFEWAEKIGVKRIGSLLNKLSHQHKRYVSFLD